MNHRALILGIGICSASSIYAAPEDLFLQAKSFSNSPPASISIGIDAVNETIDVFDLRAKEGVSSGAGDYLGGHISAAYQFAPQWTLEGAYWYREIDYTQDTNAIHSPLLGVRYFPDLNLDAKDALFFRLSIWGNRADELRKSTATLVNKRRLEQVTVNKPQDWQLQFDGVFSRQLDHMNILNAFASVGYSQVKVDQLKIQATANGCLMDISIHSNNQFDGQLSKPCTSGNLLLTELTVTGNASEYGIDMQKDLNYDAYFASIGGSWNWRYKQFESQLAYQYQHLWRNDIDDRISSFGNAAIEDNHSLGLKFSYDFHPQVRGFLQGEIYQNNFVGTIPFIYNGVTASRLDKRYGLASIGVTFHNF